MQMETSGEDWKYREHFGQCKNPASEENAEENAGKCQKRNAKRQGRME